MPAASLFPNRFAKPMAHVFFNPLYQNRLLLRFWPTEAPSTMVLCAGKAVVWTPWVFFGRPDKICRAPSLLFFLTNGKRKL